MTYFVPNTDVAISSTRPVWQWILIPLTVYSHWSYQIQQHKATEPWRSLQDEIPTKDILLASIGEYRRSPGLEAPFLGNAHEPGKHLVGYQVSSAGQAQQTIVSFQQSQTCQLFNFRLIDLF